MVAGPGLWVSAAGRCADLGAVHAVPRRGVEAQRLLGRVAHVVALTCGIADLCQVLEGIVFGYRTGCPDLT